MAALGLVACGESALQPAEPTPRSDAGEANPDAAVEAPDAEPPTLDATPAPDAAGAPDATAAAPDASQLADAGVVVDASQPADAGGAGIGLTCFGDIWDPATPGPDYDQFAPVMGSHCNGTNQQNITGVERVVFLGDSVTVGTPPTVSGDFYRSRLADRLAQRFNLQAPSAGWKMANVLDGTSLVQSSGDFASCAKWGAETNDLLVDNHQIEDCIPESERTKRTLVIMTVGGNDIGRITKNGAPSGGHTYAEVEAMTQRFVQNMRDAIHWFKDDPARFPNGVFVVFANMYEFTDGTGDVSSCAAAGLAGFDEAWADPSQLADLVIWANEEFMGIAVETGTDMILSLEHFCGHGYHNDDPNSRCYRGPNTERWFDLSCIHPNPTGHGVLADMFMSVVEE